MSVETGLAQKLDVIIGMISKQNQANFLSQPIGASTLSYFMRSSSSNNDGTTVENDPRADTDDAITVINDTSEI